MTQASYRAAAITLLDTVAGNANVPLQTYRARPLSIYTPTAFVEAMSDETTTFADMLFQHTPLVEIICIWGLFDSGEAVDQRDAFVDAFHAYVRTQYHAAGANTLIGPRSLDDIPNYVPDWLAPEKQQNYYATRIIMEGTATD